MSSLMAETLWIVTFLFIARKLRLKRRDFVNENDDATGKGGSESELRLVGKGSIDSGAEVAIVGGGGPMVGLKRTRSNSNGLHSSSIIKARNNSVVSNGSKAGKGRRESTVSKGSQHRNSISNNNPTNEIGMNNRVHPID